MMEPTKECTWCGVESKELSPFRVSYGYRKGPARVGPEVWWLSPCCAKNMTNDGDSGRIIEPSGWIVEPIEEGN